VGVDLHERSWHVTGTDGESEIVIDTSMPPDGEVLLRRFERYGGYEIREDERP